MQWFPVHQINHFSFFLTFILFAYCDSLSILWIVDSSTMNHRNNIPQFLANKNWSSTRKMITIEGSHLTVTIMSDIKTKKRLKNLKNVLFILNLMPITKLKYDIICDILFVNDTVWYWTSCQTEKLESLKSMEVITPWETKANFT